MARNLLRVALSLARPGSAVTVSAAAADEVDLEVCCAASPGLDAAMLLDPFCPILPNGSGLALATARRLAEAHRGRLVVDADEDGLIRFVVVLPRA